jgi:transcriptional regulator with XRE-family HTH domain
VATTADRLLLGVGRRLAEVREGRGWSQEEAAERLGLSSRMIRKLESGGNTTVRRLALIALAYDVRLASLFEEPRSELPRRPGRPRLTRRSS